MGGKFVVIACVKCYITNCLVMFTLLYIIVLSWKYYAIPKRRKEAEEDYSIYIENFLFRFNLLYVIFCALLGLVGGGTGTLSLTYNGLCLARLTPLWDGGEGSLFVSLPTPIKPKNGQKITMKTLSSVLYISINYGWITSHSNYHDC